MTCPGSSLLRSLPCAASRIWWSVVAEIPARLKIKERLSPSWTVSICQFSLEGAGVSSTAFSFEPEAEGVSPAGKSSVKTALVDSTDRLGRKRAIKSAMKDSARIAFKCKDGMSRRIVQCWFRMFCEVIGMRAFKARWKMRIVPYRDREKKQKCRCSSCGSALKL